MDKSDFEVLLFKSRNIENTQKVVDQLGKFGIENGYIVTILDNNKKWDAGTLENVKISIEHAEITEIMVKNAQKKVIILQIRGFLPEDLIKIKEKINNTLIDYDISVLLLDKNITLEKSDTFFNRIAKHLRIYELLKSNKKRKFKEGLNE